MVSNCKQPTNIHQYPDYKASVFLCVYRGGGTGGGAVWVLAPAPLFRAGDHFFRGKLGKINSKYEEGGRFLVCNFWDRSTDFVLSQ